MTGEGIPETHERTHIDIHKPEEVGYWTAKMGCTAEELIQAVLSAGPHVIAVREWMGKTWGR